MDNTEEDFVEEIPLEEAVRQIEVTIELSTKSAVWTAIVAGRCCEDRETLVNGENALPTGSIVMVFKPASCTFRGHGEVYNRFKETGLITGYPGEGTQVATSSDPNYKEAALKVLEYHETFKGMKNDVDKNRFFRKGQDKVLRVIRGKRGKYKPRKKKDSACRMWPKVRVPSQSASATLSIPSQSTAVSIPLHSAAVSVPSQSATVLFSVQLSQFAGESKDVHVTEDVGKSSDFDQLEDHDLKPLPLKKRKVHSKPLSEIDTNNQKETQKDCEKRSAKKVQKNAKAQPDIHYTVQQEVARLKEILEEDEGYGGSQEKRNEAVTLEDAAEDSFDFFQNSFSQTPNLGDCSFDILCAQASSLPQENNSLPFEDL